MADCRNMSTSEVQRLARQNDKDALFEMVMRVPRDIEDDPVESCAWQDYWFERAAEAGHVDAKCRYAMSLINRIMNAEDRQKAIKYFQSLSDDYDAGRLYGDYDMESGVIGKIWLGVMLCEGYHTRRDAVSGARLLESAHGITNGFEGFGYRYLYTIGEVYCSGLAQPGEDPSAADIMKAIGYYEAAIRKFNPARDDPNNRGILQLTKDLLASQKERVKTHRMIELSEAERKERRDKMMYVHPAGQQRVNADKAALARLRQRLASEGWGGAAVDNSLKAALQQRLAVEGW